MFGIQTSELVVIALVAVLVFGPEKVPALFHRVGRLVSKLQRSADDMWTTLQTEVNQAKQPFEEIVGEVTRTKEPFEEIAADVQEALDEPDRPPDSSREADGGETGADEGDET